jgi:EmrB/QacA subfamily drug resistance transporter
MSETGTTQAPALRLSSPQGRWVLLSCVLGSGLAGIDATVVNIALPNIGRDFGVGFAALQWTVTAYTLTLASLILLGGSLGDRFGRRRMFVVGVIWFAVASVACAAAPGAVWLILARALQGVGGALLTPASLAILQASFAERDRARAIGAWSALAGAASAIAPFVGGWLIQAGSWRWVFLINAPLAVLVVLVAQRHVPETRDLAAADRIDVPGSVLGVLGLGGVTAGILAASDSGWLTVPVLAPFVAGLCAFGLFVLVERRARAPMLPLSLFRSMRFSAANGVTLLLYGAISGSLLLLVVALQTVSGFSPLAAGTALLPITVVMLLLAARFGALARRIGPRWPMSFGPLVAACGLVLLAVLVSPHTNYLTDILPAATIFGLGLAMFVAPLTATVLDAVPASHAGIASGVNNAVARAAGLLAIAAIPVIVGLTGDVYGDPARFLPAFRAAMWIGVGLLGAGGLLAAATIRTEPVECVHRIGTLCVSPAGDPPLPAARR